MAEMKMKAATKTATFQKMAEATGSNKKQVAQFFDALPNSVSDARTPLDLLLAAKDSPYPPTTYWRLRAHG